VIMAGMPGSDPQLAIVPPRLGKDLRAHTAVSQLTVRLPGLAP
jgi:hypothetical protein